MHENAKKRIANVGSDVEKETIKGIIAMNIWSNLFIRYFLLINSTTSISALMDLIKFELLDVYFLK